MQRSDKQLLLMLARESIKTYFSEGKPDVSKVRHLSKKQGAFVTLHVKGLLRGCIGFPLPVHPLYIAIIEAARSAAFSDPRFPPLTLSELDSVKIEISVLSVPKLMKVDHPSQYANHIVIGKHGLIIDGPFGSGLLLPQVATENDFNVTSFLNCVCQKAGLGFNAWKDLSNKVYIFDAEVFGDQSP